MKVEVRGQGMNVPPPLHGYVERRLRFALGRFAPRIRGVVARLGDVNGPRGGVDKRCQVTVRFVPAGEVTVDDVAGQFTVAIDGAADRAGRAAARRLQRDIDLSHQDDRAVRTVRPSWT